ncbi:unnamed protein product [Sphacelaria rigidula]
MLARSPDTALLLLPKRCPRTGWLSLSRRPWYAPQCGSLVTSHTRDLGESHSGANRSTGGAITSDTDRREQLTQVIISELKQSIPGDAVSSLAANFADVLLRAAEKVVSRMTREPRTPGWFEHAVIRTEFEHA